MTENSRTFSRLILPYTRVVDVLYQKSNNEALGGGQYELSCLVILKEIPKNFPSESHPPEGAGPD